MVCNGGYGPDDKNDDHTDQDNAHDRDPDDNAGNLTVSKTPLCKNMHNNTDANIIMNLLLIS